ncbi:MAG TPA: aminotransferase class V-fold PLP-dependent enzyme [Asticcacaulis sp.]|nr:aminotransferase class V-fold PLP-dependent enzyme [Asticcacaulis sp.]
MSFILPKGGPYLMAHSVGCLPAGAQDALARAVLDPWAQGDPWPHWLMAIEDFRSALANLLGGAPEDYCPQPNLSAGLFSLLSGLPHTKKRGAVLVSAHAFPSLLYVIQQLHDSGLTLKILPPNANPGDAQLWADAMSDEVCAVVMMHVHSNTGAVTPVTEVAAIAQERGVFSIVDIAQSAGILDVDLPGMGVDAAIGSCVKWLCGGPGAGFLWVRPDAIHALTPPNVGWFSHEAPFAFQSGFRYAPDARRFWGGTPSVAPYALATEGLSLISDIGVATIRAHNRRLIARLGVPFDADRTGGTLCLRLGDGAVGYLKDTGVKFDQRDGLSRLSFHIWNTDQDADRVADALERFS